MTLVKYLLVTLCPAIKLKHESPSERYDCATERTVGSGICSTSGLGMSAEAFRQNSHGSSIKDTSYASSLDLSLVRRQTSRGLHVYRIGAACVDLGAEQLAAEQSRSLTRSSTHSRKPSCLLDAAEDGRDGNSVKAEVEEASEHDCIVGRGRGRGREEEKSSYEGG